MDLSNWDLDYMIPKETIAIPQFQIPHVKSQKEPDLNLVSRGCQHEKILNFTPKIWTQDPWISYKYFDTGPSKPDI